jgi:serine phosphatase RsbU (regulator of sigma subunit)
MKYGFILIISIFFMAAINNASAAETIGIDSNLSKQSIGSFLEYYEDKDKIFNIDALVATPGVRKIDWLKSGKDAITIGYTKSAYWVRFSVINSSAHSLKFYLVEEYPLLNHVALYAPVEKNNFVITETGGHFIFSHRPVQYRSFVFPLELKAGESKTYYMRYETEGTMNCVLSVFSPEAFQHMREIEAIFLWIFCGIFLIMIIYNFIIFLTVRDLSYLYYILFLAFYLLISMSLNGIASQYLWPNSIWWGAYCRPILLGLIVFTILNFIRHFIRTFDSFRIVDKIFLALACVNLLASLTTPLVNSYRVNMSATVVLAGGSIAVGLSVISYLAIIKKSRQSLFVFISYTLFFICTMFYLLKSLGLMADNFIANWSMHFGAIVFVTMLSLGLADKINTMRKELKVLNLNLEDKVRERTEELQNAMEEMEALNHELIEARDAIWGEMQLAKKIQTVLLPDKPAIKDYEITGFMRPATEVGGDYYDIINVSGKDWIVIGDVSGHGVPAGLIMMMVQTSIHSVLRLFPQYSPSEVLVAVNAVIYDNIKKLDEDKYMTITVIACNEGGKFHFSGHHQDIMIYRSATGLVELRETDGMWLGIFNEIGSLLSDSDLTIGPGDVMLLYTDGITEARSGDDSLFSQEKLEMVFKELGRRNTKEIKDGIMKELEGYDCRDDVTIVVVKKVADIVKKKA